MKKLMIGGKNRLIQIEEVGDEFQLLEEMGFIENHRCSGCNKILLDYYKTCRFATIRGKIPIYICLNCGKRNTEKDLDFRLWHKKETVRRFIELRTEGWTPYKIVSHNLLNIGMMTSFRWERRFKKQIKEFKNAQL